MNKDIKVNVAKTLHISPSAFFEGKRIISMAISMIMVILQLRY